MAATNAENINQPKNSVSTNNYGENFPDRIKKIDRSDAALPQNTNIRNVRTSDMPGNPKNQTSNSHPTIDISFNQSYANAGIQPTLDNNLLDKKNESQKQTRRDVKVEYTYQTNTNKSQKELVLTNKINRSLLGGNKIKNDLSRKKAFRVNLGIWSAGGTSWLFFQLPLALLANLLFGAQYGFDKIVETASTVSEDDGFLVSAGKYAFKAVKAVAEAGAWLFEKVTGLDVSALSPGSASIFLQSLIFFYGFFVLFLIFIIYKLALLNPLLGRGASMKTGSFLLAIIGYFFPILNLFPWFYLWTFAVLLRPK